MIKDVMKLGASFGEAEEDNSIYAAVGRALAHNSKTAGVVERFMMDEASRRTQKRVRSYYAKTNNESPVSVSDGDVLLLSGTNSEV